MTIVSHSTFDRRKEELQLECNVSSDRWTVKGNFQRSLESGRPRLLERPFDVNGCSANERTALPGSAGYIGVSYSKAVGRDVGRQAFSLHHSCCDKRAGAIHRSAELALPFEEMTPPLLQIAYPSATDIGKSRPERFVRKNVR